MELKRSDVDRIISVVMDNITKNMSKIYDNLTKIVFEVPLYDLPSAGADLIKRSIDLYMETVDAVNHGLSDLGSIPGVSMYYMDFIKKHARINARIVWMRDKMFEIVGKVNTDVNYRVRNTIYELYCVNGWFDTFVDGYYQFVREFFDFSRSLMYLCRAVVYYGE